MKYSAAVIAFAVGAFALPQDASITSAPVASVSLTPQVSCALSCSAGDVTCQAACYGVARPNSSQAVASNECAAKCDQGDGSPEATEAYAKCQQDCFASLYPSTQTVAPFAPGSPATQGGSATAGASNAANTGSPSGTAQVSGSGSPTGSAAQHSGTGAANANSVQIVGAGLAGLMAIFAL
jgi:hypothetical protein